MHWLNRTRPCLTLAILLASSPLLAAPFAYVGSSESATLQRIDVETGAITTTYPLVAPAYGVTTDEAVRKVYVTNPNANSLTVVDVTTGGTIFFTIGNNPRGVVVDSSTSRVYVANAGSSNVVSFLPTNVNARQSIGLPSGFAGGAMALSRTGNRMVVVDDGGTGFGDGSVVIIDGPAQVAPVVALATPCGSVRITGGVALSPDGNVVYALTDKRALCIADITNPATPVLLANLSVASEVPLSQGNARTSRIFTNASGSLVYAAMYPGQLMSNPFAVAGFESAIAVIDAEAKVISGYVRTACGAPSAYMYAAAPTPDGNHLLALCGANGAAPLIDLTRMQVERTLPIAPPGPSSTNLLTSVGNYVANF